MKPVPILRAFETVLGLRDPSFAAWRALIGGAFGCPLDADAARTFAELTGGRAPPTQRVRELICGIGRRGGKNFVTARVVVYLALLCEWALAPGETGVVLVLASTREQASVAFRYIKGALDAHPALAREVVNVTASCITLRSGIEIRIGTADNASVRGSTLLAVVCDEFAFWSNEDATEVLRAVRPGMATQPNAMLLIISSVYSASGPLAELHRRFYGTDDPHVLFALATTRQMNPTITEEFVDAELARDPVANAAEYLSVFRSDVASFLDAALIDEATRRTPRDLPRRLTAPNGTAIRYVAGLDVSGGRGDATACAVAHADAERVIVDACRRWPAPHDPKAVAAQAAAFLAEYGLTHAVADNYGAELSRVLYGDAGVTLIASDHVRSDVYLRLLPLLTTGRVELPPDPVLRIELLGLERRTARSGKDSVDHRPGGHDDLANAVALAAVSASRADASTLRAVTIPSDVLDGYADTATGRAGWMPTPWHN
jgi:hypothetical protein